MLQELIPFNMQHISSSDLLRVEMLVWLVGVTLLLLGARFYRLAIMAPGFALGALIAVHHLDSQSPESQLFLTVIVGIVGALFLSAMEKMAITLLGAISCCGLLFTVYPLVSSQQMPWYAAGIAALCGALLFPMLWKKMLPLLTSLAGALCICWASNKLESQNVLFILWGVGAIFQHIVLSKKS